MNGASLSAENGAPLIIETEQQSDRWLVRLTGELDLSNVDMLDAELTMRDGGLPIVLDLSQLAFLDNTGLSVLLRHYPDGLRVQNPSDQAAEVLRLCSVEALIGP